MGRWCLVQLSKWRWDREGGRTVLTLVGEWLGNWQSTGAIVGWSKQFGQFGVHVVEVSTDYGTVEFGHDAGDRFAVDQEFERGHNHAFGGHATVTPMIVIRPTQRYLELMRGIGVFQFNAI